MTPARRITLAPSPEAGVEVELWEHMYTIRPITRSVQQSIEEIQAQTAQAQADQPPDVGDVMAKLMADLIGARLLPLEEAPPAADVVYEKWTADEISDSQLIQLNADIQEAGEAPS